MAFAAVVFLLLFFHFSVINSFSTPALYVFGNSTVANGNGEGPYLPYGMDLSDTSLHARWSNGFNIADYIAIYLGLPLVPAFNHLNKLPHLNFTKTGINYAFPGFGILPQTFPPFYNSSERWSFDNQIEKFNDTLQKVFPEIFNSSDLVDDHLAKSIFLVSFGINDYGSNYIPPANGSMRSMPPNLFAQFLLNELSIRLTTLYSLGARKFVINNIWPLGCTPLYDKDPDPQASLCNRTVNELVLPYSNSLSTTVNQLQSSLSDAYFSYPDNFEFLWDIKNNPEKYGIINTTKACYSSFISKTPCPNRDQYLYFDILHTTQAANAAFSINCFNGKLCSPRNIEGLLAA